MFPFSEVSLFATLVAGLTGMFIGMLWYGPFFGQRWAKLIGIKMDKKNMEGAGMCMIYGFINTLIMVYLVGLVLAISNPGSLQQGLLSSVVVWGVVATGKANESIWGKKTWQLFFIDMSYMLTVILAAALIFMNWA